MPARSTRTGLSVTSCSSKALRRQLVRSPGRPERRPVTRPGRRGGSRRRSPRPPSRASRPGYSPPSGRRPTVPATASATAQLVLVTPTSSLNFTKRPRNPHARGPCRPASGPAPAAATTPGGCSSPYRPPPGPSAARRPRPATPGPRGPTSSPRPERTSRRRGSRSPPPSGPRRRTRRRGPPGHRASRSSNVR